MPSFNEPSTLTEPYLTLAPENFRKIVQRQIRAAITKETNGLYGFKMGERMNSSRFGMAKPTRTIAMNNAEGFPYFLVGATPVNDVYVAHP